MVEDGEDAPLPIGLKPRGRGSDGRNPIPPPPVSSLRFFFDFSFSPPVDVVTVVDDDVAAVDVGFGSADDDTMPGGFTIVVAEAVVVDKLPLRADVGRG